MSIRRRHTELKTARAIVHRYDGKVRPTIGGPLAVYIRDLLATGLYGNRETDVVRSLVREGIIRAMPNIIKLRDFSRRAEE